MLKKFLVACSGGPDSIALLNMYTKKHLVKAVVHINYNYRKSSKRDKEIVKKFCHKHHLKLYLKTINKKIYQTNKIRNFEA
ncbi:7-cyano-7-deazaguanine synthase [bacterium]|nr:7-cyano-7-deazaguanine synthase [bacterium]